MIMEHSYRHFQLLTPELYSGGCLQIETTELIWVLHT